MNLVRHELGLSQTEKRFPTKGDLPRHLFARGQCRRRALERGAGASLSRGAPAGETELARLFAAYVEAKQSQNVLDYDDLLLYWAEMLAEPAIAADIGARFDHVLVDEYQDTNRLQAVDPAGAEAGRARADRGRRRCPVDLFVPRRDGAQHPRFPEAFSPPADDRDARRATTARRSRSSPPPMP